MPALDSDHLHLHILGAGTGESILLETTFGWGMLDCFRWADSVPPLDFLLHRGCDRLLFLGLTHPHSDHFEGMKEVVEHFLGAGGIAEFWRYTGLDAEHLFALLRSRAARKRPTFQAQQERQISELAETFDALGQAITSRHTALRLLKLPTPLHNRGGLQLEAVAPPDQLIHDSYAQVARSIEHEIIGEKQIDWDLNRLSFAIRLSFHEHRALLGGDVPAYAWTFAANDHRFPPAERLAVLKAMHHGSKRDNSPVILARLAHPDSELAVVTRYTPSQLPRREGLAALGHHFRQVITLGQELEPAQRRRKGQSTLPRFRPERVEIRLRKGLPVEVLPPVPL